MIHSCINKIAKVICILHQSVPVGVRCSNIKYVSKNKSKVLKQNAMYVFN